ncbi:GEVED domain-containing protein [Tenacibaculum amylolyticum]|uniref:GEVED domain-containing protein n=1 Tax=Tenacibaculum amylolyticum TaxID=104269 RepID=UPI003894C359
MIKEFFSLNIHIMFKEVHLYYLRCTSIKNSKQRVYKSTEKRVISWTLKCFFPVAYTIKKLCVTNTSIPQQYRSILLLFLIVPLISIGQSEVEHHQHSQQEINTYMNLYKKFIQEKKAPYNRRTITILPVVLHIVRKTDGTTDYNLNNFLSKIPQGFATINRYILPLQTHFYLAEIKYINSDILYENSVNRSNYEEFLDNNSTNFFIINEGENLSSFPNSNTTPNAVYFSKNTFGSTTDNTEATILHEIGHYFGLVHTNTNTEFGNEYPLAESVARGGPQLNCTSSGDYLCSTPADAYGSPDSTDKYGATYFPDKTNIMSYYVNERVQFTEEQYNIMQSAIDYRLNDNRYDIDGYVQEIDIATPEITFINNTSLYNELSWTNVDHNLGYIIERSTQSDTSGFSPIAGLTKDTQDFQDNDIQSNTNYWYRVIAVNSKNNYSTPEKVFVGGTYCNLKNTCDGYGFVPDKITLSNTQTNLIDLDTIPCSNNVSVLDYSNITLTSNDDFTLHIQQSENEIFFYNLFIDFNMDGDFDDTDEWVIKNELSTNNNTFESNFNLYQKIIRQGTTSMRFVSSFYKNTNGIYPLKNACTMALGFAQDFKITVKPENENQKIFWNGSTNNNWFNPSNWSTNTIPSNNADIVIPNSLNNYPTVNTPITVNTLTINSGASIILNEAIEGDVTYKKQLERNNWYLTASPVMGETIENIIENSDLITSTEGKLSFAYFDNTNNNSWNYISDTTTGNISIGAGYLVKLASNNYISFNGTLNTTDTTFLIKKGITSNMNLLGNPFAAYINSTTFTSDNTTHLSEETVWVWNGKNYEAHNLMNPIEIEPSQGFFVEAYQNGNVTFNSANQQHKTNEMLAKPTASFSFELIVDNETEQRATKVFYVNGTTTAFDNGYDSKIFEDDIHNTLNVFTSFVTDDQQKKLAIQTLPDTDYETMIIPIGLIANANEEINFSLNTENLPNDLSIMLEDRLANRFIDIHEEFYSVTLNEVSNGTGRFYIHTTARLSNGSTDVLSGIHIYKSDFKQISITGLETDAKIKVYSLLGEQLFNTKLNPKNKHTIELPNTACGIYLIKLQTEKGIGVKKIKI